MTRLGFGEDGFQQLPVPLDGRPVIVDLKSTLREAEPDPGMARPKHRVETGSLARSVTT